jgi:GT2 family glycosyltransferase
MSAAALPAPLAWTGERMVPTASDLLTEAFHWQRYTYFRPWYMKARIVDAASGEGYGTGYAALFAADALGLDVDPSATAHANARYPRARFETADVTSFDYSEADLVLSFETIEHVPDPAAFLASLDSCKGTIVVSTPNRRKHSPGNSVDDKPWNEFHTVEWTPEEFAVLIQTAFPHRQVRFLSQEDRWPGLIREGLDNDARYTIAVIDGGELPYWPRIGLAMPCCGEADAAAQAITRLSMHYPGELKVGLVAQGCDEAGIERLRTERNAAPHLIELIEEKKNQGYGQGANLALLKLQEEGFDLYGVTNDDITPAPDCLPQLASAAVAIQEAGHKVGMIGPVSNEVSGEQRVQIGSYSTLAEMHDRALAWGSERHSHVDCTIQVRGLFFLMSAECLEAIGGFDPIFGLGNFEDDDLNLRARLAGFPLWIAPGAFLHHVGSSSFKRLDLDYEDGMLRNLALFLEKYEKEDFAEAMAREAFPAGFDPFIPLDAKPKRSAHFITINGAPVDLIHQASEFDLASWIVTKLRDKPREARAGILEALDKVA